MSKVTVFLAPIRTAILAGLVWTCCFPVHTFASSQPEAPFSDTVEVWMNRTPSNLLVAAGNVLTYDTVANRFVDLGNSGQLAHLRLMGTSHTTPVFQVTAEAAFTGSQWVVTNVAVRGTVPAGSTKPEFRTGAVSTAWNDPYQAVAVSTSGGTDYQVTWVIEGTATKEVRPVLLPRFRHQPWRGHKRGWMMKVRNTLTGFDPSVLPFGSGSSYLRQVVDSVMTTITKSSNYQVTASYEIKELFYGGPVENINCSVIEQNTLATVGITATNWRDSFDWAIFTAYPALQQRLSLDPLGRRTPQGCAPYHAAGAWYPDLAWPRWDATVVLPTFPASPGVMLHEFGHTIGLSHPLYAGDYSPGQPVTDLAVFSPPLDVKFRTDWLQVFNMGATRGFWWSPMDRASLGWLQGRQVVLAATTGVYELYGDQDNLTMPEKPLILQVPVKVKGTSDFVYLFLPNGNHVRDKLLGFDADYFDTLGEGIQLAGGRNEGLTFGPGSFREGPGLMARELVVSGPIVPGQEIHLRWEGTDVRITNLERRGNRALVRIRFNGESVPSPQPDLTIIQFFPEWPATGDLNGTTFTAKAGDVMRFTPTVKNAGTAEVPASSLAIYIDGALFTKVTLGRIPAGQAITYVTPTTWKATWGTHTVKAVSDSDAQLSELDEANNTRSLTLTVTPPPPSTQPVVWTQATGVAVSGGSLTKTAATDWGNAGAISSQSLASGEGFVEFTVAETTTHRIVGLSTGNSTANWDDIDFGLYLYGWNPISVKVYEAGVFRGEFGPFASGDTMRVAVSGGKVTYARNGTVFYTSTKPPISPLLVDASLYDTGATIATAVVSSGFSAAPPPPPSGTPLVTAGGTSSSLRNDFSGWVGTAFKVGATPLTVTALGRYVVTGSSGTHVVKLVQFTGTTGTDVPWGSVTVSTAGVPVGTYAYTTLRTPITLEANGTYFLVSQEVAGGDRWYDYWNNAITLASVVSPVGPTWADNNSTNYIVANPYAAQTYGPVNLKYQ